MGWRQSKADIKGHWDENGWVAVRGFLNEEEVAALREEIDRYIRDVVPTVPEYEVMYDVKGRLETLKRLGHMSKYDKYFSDLIHTGKFTALAELLLGGDVVPQYCQLFNKPARVGVETPAHQDSYYIPLTPNEALTMWLALDNVDDENGCLRYISSTHKRPVRPHGPTEIFGFSQGVSDYGDADYAAEIAVPAEPGDVVIHHWQMVHRAGRNTSDRDRWGLGTVYHSARAKPDLELQEARARELEKKRAEWAAKGQSGR